MNAEEPADLTRTTLRLLFTGVLIAGSFWVLRPFLMPVCWATMIVVATWPLFQRTLAWSGRRGFAVAVMTLALVLVFVVPLYLAITTILENAERIADLPGEVTTITVPHPPEWVEDLPFVGPKIAARWQDAAAASPEERAARLAPHARRIVAWFASHVGGAGVMILNFLLTAIVAALLYANGEKVAHGVRLFARRLAGARGDEATTLAAQAVRAVALGVIVTALVQSCLGGIGLAVAGAPLVPILTAIMFIFGVAQVGPAPVLLPAVIWVYWNHGALWGTLMLVWAILVGALDNVLRPILIKRGANLPLVLIFAGVLGGLIGFGVIGLFVGPVVLAVAYTLLVAWVQDGGSAPPPVDRVPAGGRGPA